MRKLIFSALACGVALLATAQSNNQFVYSAIARDAQGAPIVNQNISVEISILSDSTNNTASYADDLQNSGDIVTGLNNVGYISVLRFKKPD